MTEMEFGKIIEKLIYFSGEKNYSLARELGYDVSYLSKWISGTMFPTFKNIKIICEKIADFIIKHTNKSSQDEIADYFNIDKDEYHSEELLIEYIKNMLYESYLTSRENEDGKIVEKSNRKKIPKYNSVIVSNPKFVKKYLDESIMDYTKKQNRGDVIVLSDLFSLGRDDKLHMAGIRNGSASKTKMENVTIKFLMSFDENVDDIVFNTMLFINMIMVYSNINFKLYSCKHSKYSQVVAVKGKSFTYAVYTDIKKCLFLSTSEDAIVVHDMYHSLEDMIETRSKPTFLEMSSEEIIFEKRYMEYIIGRHLKWIIGYMNELLMPSDLFMEIGKEVFGESEEVIKELENINLILQNATYKSNNIQVLIYESAIKQYISTGVLSFFNIKVSLTLEQIQRHIEYMVKIFDENKNIEFKLITDTLVDDFKNMANPSVFISKSLSFITVNCEEEISDKNRYMIIKDSRLDNIFKRFFEEIWNSDKENVTMNREEVVSRFSDLLGYIKILKNNRN